MNVLRKWTRNVFGFSGTEINGFLILLPLTLVLLFSEPLYHRWILEEDRLYAADSAALDSLMGVWSPATKDAEEAENQLDSLFSFDPNTAGVEDLQRLGFSLALANRIAAYRQKGGVFRAKPDLLKIYGLDSALYNQLYKYIDLPSRNVAGGRRHRTVPRRASGAMKGASQEQFDINTADTILLKRIYGIGSKLAARIVKFRDALGGFVSTDQLREVYGLDSLVVKRLLQVVFIEKEFVPERIDINTADEKALSRHPYIGFKVARALLNYRFQHGDFVEVGDIKKLPALKAEEVERLLPYLEVKH